MRAALAVLALVAASACAINTGVAGGFYVEKALADDCARHCATLGMRLAAVVVVHSTGGCVCEPKDRAADATSRGGAAVAGGAVIQAMEEQRRAAAGAGAAGGAAAHR